MRPRVFFLLLVNIGRKKHQKQSCAGAIQNSWRSLKCYMMGLGIQYLKKQQQNNCLFINKAIMAFIHRITHI